MESHGGRVRHLAVVPDITGKRVAAHDPHRRVHLLSTAWQIVAAPEGDVGDKINRLLAAGCELFGMRLGIVSEIDGERYTVRHVHAPGSPLAPGAEFELGRTYCSIVVSVNQSVAIAAMGESEWSDHPCYSEFNLEAYIGVVINVDGKPYGTLNFSSPQPLGREFSDMDVEFMEMLGDWVGTVLTAERRRDRAVERSDRLRALLAEASHEIRAPLAGIVGHAMVLEEGLNGDPAMQQLTHIRTAAEFALTLVRDVLDLARLEADVDDVETEPARPHALVASAIKLVSGMATAKRIEVTSDVSPGLPSVNVDSRRMVQLLLNLLANAVRYTARDGRVGVNASYVGDEVHLAVWDTGRGIPQDRLERIFEPFEPSDERADWGAQSGLGLALCREIAEMHGARIWAESSETGSRFTVAIRAG